MDEFQIGLIGSGFLIFLVLIGVRVVYACALVGLLGLVSIIGWTAVIPEISYLPIVMFLIIFFWTPPHFWALSVYRFNDYNIVEFTTKANALDYDSMDCLLYTSDAADE